jgi:hypothetical protein
VGVDVCYGTNWQSNTRLRRSIDGGTVSGRVAGGALIGRMVNLGLMQGSLLFGLTDLPVHIRTGNGTISVLCERSNGNGQG